MEAFPAEADSLGPSFFPFYIDRFRNIANDTDGKNSLQG
jgi:hypothetical protein